MSNIILPRLWSKQLRDDTTESINLLMQFGKMHPETYFSYIEMRGKAVVHLFMVDEERGETYGDAFTLPVDLIVAAKTTELARSRKLQLEAGRDAN